MPRATLNGKTFDLTGDATLLDAYRSVGVEVPTLCDDPRLVPLGGCRLCLVQVAGMPHPVPACATRLTDGMVVESHTADIEETRRGMLTLLARGYPADAVSAFPEKPFHRWLAHYGVKPQPDESAPPPPPVDQSHPCIQVDLSRCIDCFRCVRICGEVQGQDVWQIWERGTETHVVAGPGGPFVESGCVSCGACVDSCPSGALEDRSVLSLGFPESWTRTTCPYCGVGCEMQVGTREGRIVQVKPALDAPVNRGHLCAKGRYAFGFVDSPGRVTRPRIREGRRWREVSWDEAVAFTAGELRRILDRYGPESVGMLGSARATNEENYLTQKLARLVLGTHNVDCCARVCHAPSAAGLARMLGTGAATSSYADIEQARAFLLAGTNATENHPIVGARIRQAVRAGARLVVVDPRRTELAACADIHLQIRPGTNIPLLNALAAAILEEGLEDRDFLARRTSNPEAYREHVRAWTPERAAAICGVEAADIRAAARIYATAKPAISFHGLGVTEHTQGTEGVMAIADLALLTGNLGRPGSGVNPLRGQNNVQGSAHMGCEPGHLTGYATVEAGRERHEAVWGAPLPTTPGLDLMQMIDAAAAGHLKALWAIGYDILLTNPDAATTRRALENLELLIVQDPFENETARACAHVLLPACTAFEKDGTFMNGERRVQRVRRAVTPRGESKTDWEILGAVAAALGQGERFPYRSAAEIWDEIRQVWPAGAGMTWDRLERAGLQWPCPTPDHPGTSLLHTETFSNGDRAAFQLIDYHPTPEAAGEDYPFLLNTGRVLPQFNAATMTGPTPMTALRPTDLLDMAPEDAAALGLQEGDRVRLRSRYGETVLPVGICPNVRPGELFATFHTAEAFLNKVTGPYRDGMTGTPEYKVTAVGIEREKTGATPESPSMASPWE